LIDSLDKLARRGSRAEMPLPSSLARSQQYNQTNGLGLLLSLVQDSGTRDPVG
jgi:hypothetical protein